MDPQPVQIRLLGRFGVRRDGAEVPPGEFGGRLARTLVRLLLTRRGQLVPRDVLVEALWSAQPPADPAGNLKILVSRARRALGDPSLITAGSGGYSFVDDDRSQVDAEVFVTLVEAGRAHLAAARRREAHEAFLSALAEWGGEPLPEDAYAEWAQEYRRELSRAHLEALEGAAAAALALGDAPGAAALAGRAAALEPLREAPHLLLVEALAASGDAAAALSTFDALRLRLAEELGVDPSPEALDLHLRVLRREVPRLAPSVTTAPVAAPPVAEMPFVGRDGELAQLLGALSEGGVVLISGHAGAGKSRLLAEAGARGPVPIIASRAFRPEREEPWGLARSLLREALLRDVDVAGALSDLEAGALAAIVPELWEIRRVPGAPADPETRRALSMQGAVRVLSAASAPALAVLADDVQWADSTSLGLLHLVADRVGGLRLVVAYRSEEVDPGAPLDPFLSGLMGRGALTIDLGPLPPKALEELVDEPALASLIADETDRMPLSLREALQSLVARGVVEPTERGAWRAQASFDRRLVARIVRRGQRRAIERRVGSLPRSRREILSLLALLGREAPPHLLAEATGMVQPVVLGALDGLARAHLVRLGEHGWAVAHDVIGETIVGSLSREQKGPLHSRLAAALKEEGEVDPAELAAHLLGAGDIQKATTAYAEAARRRLDRFADQEAARLAHMGLGLEPTPSTQRGLLETRSEARRRRGDLAGAREDVRTLLAETPRGPDHSLMMSRMAMLTSGAQDYVRAAELAEMAVTEAGDHPKARGEALFVGGIVDMNRADFERAEERFAEALALFEHLGDPQGVAGIVDARGMASVLAGRLPEAAEELDRAARLFLDFGNLLRAVSPRTVCGNMLAMMGQPEKGLPQVEEALGLARALGQLEDESYALISRAMVISILGRHREALAEAEAALEIAERIGHREWTCHALWVLGSVRRDAGDLDGAEPPLRRALELAENMPVHASWAAARLAQALIARGDLDAAEPLVGRALAEALPGNLPEAYLARAELAAARGAPNAGAIAREALALAGRMGYALIVPRLRQLAQG